MPNATSARRTRPVDASSAPAASRLGPMRMRALRQLNRVVQPLARRCYFMPQPKKRSLIGTIHQECGARVTRQGGSRAICSSRRRVVVGPADRGDGCGSGCAMHRNAARPSLAYVRSRTQVVARRRSWFRSRPICSSHRRHRRPSRSRRWIRERVRDAPKCRPAIARVRLLTHASSRTQAIVVPSRRRRRRGEPQLQQRSCSACTWTCHGRCGTGTRRRPRSPTPAELPRARALHGEPPQGPGRRDGRGRDGDPEGAGRVVGMVVDGHPSTHHTIRREIKHRTRASTRAL